MRSFATHGNLPTPVIPLTQTMQNGDATFSGPFASDQTISLKFIKLGNQVMIEIPGVNAAQALIAPAKAEAISCIPAAFRPSRTIVKPVVVRSNAVLVSSPGKLHCLANGNIEIYANLVGSGLFSLLGTNGWEACTINYSTA